MPGYDGPKQLAGADPNVLAGFVKAWRQSKAPRKALVALVAAGVVEANLGNPNYGDRDSVGSLQQRAGWGTKAARMDPHRAAVAFLVDLTTRVWPRHHAETAGALAQRVQRSAYPDRYQQAVPAAEHVIARLIGHEGDPPILPAPTKETPVAWFLAPSLVQLQKELDGKFPGRPKDGTIGDASHAARASEHNPDRDSDPMPLGAVSAMDIYTAKIDKAAVLKALMADPRCWYCIHAGFIYSRTHGFAKRKYTGSNPHTSHIHVSLMQTLTACNSKASWRIGGTVSSPPTSPPPASTHKFPVLSKGDEHDLVPALKRFFGLDDGDETFGAGLDRAVRSYQQDQGLVVDGVVGKQSWARITTALKLPGWAL